MESKTRYNSAYKSAKNISHSKGYIEKYLKKEIDFLLAPSFSQLNGVDFEDIYISSPDTEEFLSSALTSSSVDRILYLTGLTGIWKVNGPEKSF